jgi:hypothetical protein
MTIGTGNFAELLWPGIKEIWGTSYNDYEPLYTKIFEVKTSTLRFEKEQGVTGLGLAGVKNEGSPAAYQDPFQGYQQEYNNITYALGTTVTREMYEDDQYSYINEAPEWLARSMRQTEETIAFNHLNRSVNTAFTGADGVTLLNDSHPLVGGGTYRNQLSVAADLSQTSLETAVQDLMDLVDEQSLKIRVTPECLIVPTSLNFTARKLLETEFVVGSADNDKNTTMGIFKDLVVSPYLTDTDAWYIKTTVPHGLTWYNRRAAEIVRDNEFDTQNLKFLTTKRFSSDWTDPRGVFGSVGAA